MHARSVILALILFSCVNLWSRQFCVVIDAGHGGKDAGAVGHVLKLQEKDVNLDISLRLASKIRTAYPDMNVVLTRSTDVFLPLQSRADIVNKNNADLFICIHTNSAETHSARGAETFILGTERMEANLDVAMRENSVMKLEKDYQTTYEGFDPNSIDSYIMFELMQNTYLDQSLRFASMVQGRFTNELKRDDRGVRQAAFWVLLKSACPSVLIETGFISNKDEERYLASDKGKREITEAVFDAFQQYYGGMTSSTDDTPSNTNDGNTTATSSPTPTKEKTKDNKEDANTNKKKIEQNHEPATPKQAQPPSDQQTHYRIQIFASRGLLQENDREFKGLKGCVWEQRGEWYRYMYGDYPTKEEAQKICNSLKDKFPGCFVVEAKN